MPLEDFYQMPSNELTTSNKLTPDDLTYLFQPYPEGRKVGFWSEPEGIMPIANTAVQDQTRLVHKLEQLEQDLLKTKFKYVKYYKGTSPCRLCQLGPNGRPKRNGSKEFYYGNLIWPEGYKHYLSEHKVKIDPQLERLLNSL